MPEVPTGRDCYSEARARIESLYAAGHRVVVAFSGGKDSTCVLNLTLDVARQYKRLPLDVSFFDEEIIYPGTPEYVQDVSEHPDIALRWFSSHKPQVNAFSREHPYWWTFDETRTPEQWVRQPPERVIWLTDHTMASATRAENFPPPPGKDLVVVLGIRAAESRNRRMSIFSSKGFLSKVNEFGHRVARPIFDWKDGDVWKAIREKNWPFNPAYDTLYRLGVPTTRLRIGPPTMTAAAVGKLRVAARAWPTWFAKMAERCPGVRTAAHYGARAITAQRRLGETWEACYRRTCIDEAPGWISARARAYAELRVRQHHYHATANLPDVVDCTICYCNGSWKAMCKAMYMGDPLSLKDGSLPSVQPEEFRPGTGRWWSGKKKAEPPSV